MRSVNIGDVTVPALGQGTWNMGSAAGQSGAEADALRLGMDLGMTLIDTAEIYASGGAERVVGDAISGRRDAVFIVTKVHPSNASRHGVPRSCDASLKRLGIGQIDLYLLHWRGDIPLDETVEAFERLRDSGKIGSWGVSNFDVDDMQELSAAGGAQCRANQILYNLARRGPEFDLLPFQAERAIPPMAYSPVEQGALVENGQLAKIAGRLGATAAQVALAWVMRRGDVIAIPKASQLAHVRDNRAAADLDLPAGILDELDRIFPPPAAKRPLEML